MPTSRTLEVRGATELSVELLAIAAKVETEIRDLGQAQGRELLHRIQEKANTGSHGPREPHIPGTGPGPNVVTGDYVLSWQIEYGIVATSVFTDAPQADRLEYGFHGVDSIGRRYDQRAYPHVGPAVDEVEEETGAKAEALIDLLLRGVR
jgi:hypothetical protein